MSILWWLLFGALAGWIASLIMKTDEEQGALANIIIGIVGAFIGGALSSLFNGPGITGFDFRSLFLAVVGAVVLLAAIRAIGRGRRHTV